MSVSIGQPSHVIHHTGARDATPNGPAGAIKSPALNGTSKAQFLDGMRELFVGKQPPLIASRLLDQVVAAPMDRSVEAMSSRLEGFMSLRELATPAHTSDFQIHVTPGQPDAHGITTTMKLSCTMDGAKLIDTEMPNDAAMGKMLLTHACTIDEGLANGSYEKAMARQTQATLLLSNIGALINDDASLDQMEKIQAHAALQSQAHAVAEAGGDTHAQPAEAVLHNLLEAVQTSLKDWSIDVQDLGVGAEDAVLPAPPMPREAWEATLATSLELKSPIESEVNGVAKAIDRERRAYGDQNDLSASAMDDRLTAFFEMRDHAPLIAAKTFRVDVEPASVNASGLPESFKVDTRYGAGGGMSLRSLTVPASSEMNGVLLANLMDADAALPENSSEQLASRKTQAQVLFSSIGNEIQGNATLSDRQKTNAIAVIHDYADQLQEGLDAGTQKLGTGSALHQLTQHLSTLTKGMAEVGVPLRQDDLAANVIPPAKRSTVTLQETKNVVLSGPLKMGFIDRILHFFGLSTTGKTIEGALTRLADNPNDVSASAMASRMQALNTLKDLAKPEFRDQFQLIVTPHSSDAAADGVGTFDVECRIAGQLVMRTNDVPQNLEMSRTLMSQLSSMPALDSEDDAIRSQARNLQSTLLVNVAEHALASSRMQGDLSATKANMRDLVANWAGQGMNKNVSNAEFMAEKLRMLNATINSDAALAMQPHAHMHMEFPRENEVAVSLGEVVLFQQALSDCGVPPSAKVREAIDLEFRNIERMAPLIITIDNVTAMGVQSLSDDVAVQAQLTQLLDDPRISDSNFLGISDRLDGGSTMQVRFGDDLTLDLSNRLSTNGEMRGVGLQKALTETRYTSLRELLTADFGTNRDPALNYLMGPLNNMIQNAEEFPISPTEMSDVLKSMSFRSVANTTAGELWSSAVRALILEDPEPASQPSFVTPSMLA